MKNEQVIFGNRLDANISLEHDDAYVLYEDRDQRDSYFTMNLSILSRHILLLGGAGSGKTNVFNLTLEQLRDDDNDHKDDVYIIFDTKGDYYKHFFKEDDYLLGNGRIYREKSVRWNVFKEILADGNLPQDYELNARELANTLFWGRSSKTQPFFCNAARDIFAYTMIYFIRRAIDMPDTRAGLLNNRDLLYFLLNADEKTYHTIFNYYPEMRGMLSYIGDGSSNQALGVLAELKNMLYDCFNGVFATEGTMEDMFSIRNAVRNKGGRAVFIEYDLTVGESLTPVYRALVDLALKEALGRSESEKGNVYLILDELKLLPELMHLDDALNIGRSMGVKVIAGLQSILQLYDMYGQDKAKVITGGFGSVFCFHTSDYASREYIKELFGDNVLSYQYVDCDGKLVQAEREGHVVELWEQMKLKKGQAIIGLADKDNPFIFQFEPFSIG